VQNSELYRRGVVAPLDDDAFESVRLCDISEKTRVRVADLAKEEDFDWLWHQGFFARINIETGLTLDDYEEDEVPPRSVPTVACIADQLMLQRGIPDSVREFLIQLNSVCSTAIEGGYPIFFIL